MVQKRLEERLAGEDIQVPWTLPALRLEWNRVKDQVAPWWAENSKEAYSSGLDGLARALKNFADSKAGRRRGRQMGFPRAKKKGRSRDACRFTTGPLRVEADRRHITLPRIGVLTTHESTRKLARRLEQGTARVLAATISRTADRWFVSFTVEVQRTIPASNGKTSVVGVGCRHTPPGRALHRRGHHQPPRLGTVLPQAATVEPSAHPPHAGLQTQAAHASIACPGLCPRGQPATRCPPQAHH